MRFSRFLDRPTLWLVGMSGFLIASTGFAGQALAREGTAVLSFPSLAHIQPYWGMFWGVAIGAVG